MKEGIALDKTPSSSLFQKQMSYQNLVAAFV